MFKGLLVHIFEAFGGWVGARFPAQAKAIGAVLLLVGLSMLVVVAIANFRRVGIEMSTASQVLMFIGFIGGVVFACMGGAVLKFHGINQK